LIATAHLPIHDSPPAARLDTPRLGPRRALFFALVLGTTVYGVSMMAALVSGGGTTRLELLILVLFTPTFAWISVAFWNAVVGFTLKALGRSPLTLERVDEAARLAPAEPLGSRTALVVPARNENADAVVRRIEAMLASLEGAGYADAFDIHLLSDTDDPDRIPAEEAAWSGLLARYSGSAGLHYRRRAANEGRKAGNIGEFLSRAGGGYDYMVVLDADSVMSADTLVRLVRTMDANPRAGLVQTVPLPGPQATRFGRFVELAAGLYGPMLAAGQSFWQGDAANYWGHNAIVRIEPFVRHCRLPVLRGRPPLGGEILSHDFVEAALLRRAGWGVYLLAEAGGSWEDVPGNLIDYARRDRRWCQGSLQHLRLLAVGGLHPISRLHFLLGAMGYVSSLLWLLLLLASTAYVAGVAPLADPTLSGIAGLGSWTLAQPLPSLLAVTAAILFLPKGLGLLLALGRRERYGGAARLLGAGVAEACFAAVVAPVMMMYHARFVLEVSVGHSVAWTTQSREGSSVPWRDAIRATGWISAGGLLWAAGTWSLSPLFFAWMAPIFVGLLAAIPLVRWTSRPSVGVFDSGPAKDRVLLSPVSGTAVARGGSVNDMYEAERGLFELRRRRALLVTHAGNGDGTAGGDALVASAEGLADETMAYLRRLADGPLHLVVTPHRARALGIQLAPGPLALRLPTDAGAGDVLHLCGERGATPPRGMTVRPATVVEAQGLALARLAQLLPAVVTGSVSSNPRAELTEVLAGRRILQVDSKRIRTALEAPRISVSQVSEAPVPLQDAEDARFILFREDRALLEHVAILIGHREAWPDPVPVRLHSACLTGDLFGSLKCDCGEQLRGSLRHFQEQGGGVLLYLQQEGRGIGLGNKLRAYSLQDGGLDTVDADCTLGFGPDERTYDAALDMLHQLGIERVQLLTNNPDKLRAVERGGIQVLNRMPLHGTLNRYNLPYVKAKVQRAGHWLGDMLSGVSGNGS
jgi:membrane glycosyltransferase